MEKVKELHSICVNAGFEGLIVRVDEGPYLLRHRSKYLLKYKDFLDEEFEIVGAETPETGKDAGTIIFVCRLKNVVLVKIKSDDGEITEEVVSTFRCRPRGTHEYRTKLYNNREDLVGKMLTVRFQDYTNEGIPRFPVGIVVRDYE